MSDIVQKINIGASPEKVYEAVATPDGVRNWWCTRSDVATAVGAVPEVVTPETGVLVPPGDPDALAAGIQSLLDDPERGETMGRAGRMRMTRRFEWRVAAEETVKVYRQVIAQHGAWRKPPYPARANALGNAPASVHAKTRTETRTENQTENQAEIQKNCTPGAS